MAAIERRLKALEDAQVPKTAMAALLIYDDDDTERLKAEYLAEHDNEEPELWVFIRILGVKPNE